MRNKALWLFLIGGEGEVFLGFGFYG